jgi:hypothetical protein
MYKDKQVIIGMATLGTRSSINKALQSLNNQTVRPDAIHVYNNSIMPEDFSDLGKFYFLHLYDEPIYYLTVDDDIEYPEDYIQKMVEAIDSYKCIITHHGRILNGPDRPYFKGHQAFRFNADQPHNCEIDVAGTGVTGFRTDLFNPDYIYRINRKRMGDLVFSLAAREAGQTIRVDQHKLGWLKPIDQNQDDSCYQTGKQDDSELREQANIIWRLKQHKTF